MPFLDFSSALPWVASGFIAGLIVAWLVRKISGVDARRAKEIEQLHGTLDDARRAHESLLSANGQLEAERGRLTAEINQLSPRAALIPQFERQVADLKQALGSVQTTADKSMQDLATLKQQSAADFAALRQDAEVKGSTAKYYEEEYGRLHAAHLALNKDWTSATGLVSKLQSEYDIAAREASEATRLRSDVAALRAQIESLNADVANERKAGQDALAKARSDENVRANHLQNILAGKDTEITNLKGELEPLKASQGQLVQDAARLNAQIEERNRELQAAQASRASMAGEIEALKSQLAAAPREDLSGEVARLGHALQAREDDLRAAQTTKAGLMTELEGLRSQLANAPKQDLSGEVQRLSAELERFRGLERTAAMDLHATRTDLSQVRTALEETTRLLGERHSEVEDLRAKLAAVPDVESYRRFKEALEAANRIAAGLPERS